MNEWGGGPNSSVSSSSSSVTVTCGLQSLRALLRALQSLVAFIRFSDRIGAFLKAQVSARHQRLSVAPESLAWMGGAVPDSAQ